MASEFNFFKTLPKNIEEIAPEIKYDPTTDLSLTTPSDVYTLDSFGYENNKGELALTKPFRIFSNTGIKKLDILITCFKKILPDKEKPQKIRDAIFRSSFLREFTQCEIFLNHIQEIVGREIIPCSFIIQRSHLNFAPVNPDWDIVAWHTDTLDYSLAILLNEETEFSNGEYEYFLGTKDKVLMNQDYKFPSKYTKTLEHIMGHGILARGDKIFHRVRPLREKGERVTLITSFLDADSFKKSDSCSIEHLKKIDDPDILRTTWIKHKCYRNSAKLTYIAENLKYEDEENIIDKLNEIRREISDLISDVDTI